MQKIAQGAEAILYKDEDIVVKDRINKSYRHPSLDAELRRARTRREAKIIDRLTLASIPCPKLISMDDKEMKIKMSFVSGEKLRDVMDDDAPKYAASLGLLIGSMHKQDIIHGDLTTSNVIVNDFLFAIDFGLSFFSKKIEDKATDLHVLFRALESRHFKVFDECVLEVKRGYLRAYPDASIVLKQLEKVESRGRNKKK